MKELGIGTEIVETHLAQVRYKLKLQTMGAITAIYFATRAWERVEKSSPPMMQDDLADHM